MPRGDCWIGYLEKGVYSGKLHRLGNIQKWEFSKPVFSRPGQIAGKGLCVYSFFKRPWMASRLHFEEKSF